MTGLGQLSALETAAAVRAGEVTAVEVTEEALRRAEERGPAVGAFAFLAPDLALEQVGLAGIGHLDAGYLSTGQTRRLALARLLVTDRKIWLLDEPLAALDAEGDALVARLVATRLETGGAVIAATHDDIPGATQTLLLGSA